MQRSLSTDSNENIEEEVIAKQPAKIDSEKLSKFVSMLKNQIQVNNSKKVVKLDNCAEIQELEG